MVCYDCTLYDVLKCNCTSTSGIVSNHCWESHACKNPFAVEMQCGGVTLVFIETCAEQATCMCWTAALQQKFWSLQVQTLMRHRPAHPFLSQNAMYEACYNVDQHERTVSSPCTQTQAQASAMTRLMGHSKHHAQKQKGLMAHCSCCSGMQSAASLVLVHALHWLVTRIR
jgi:hypothetical protein